MTYHKPEVTTIGDAASVIQGVKQIFNALDPWPSNPHLFQAVYDLDE
jgi:hypothetical protein